MTKAAIIATPGEIRRATREAGAPSRPQTPRVTVVRQPQIQPDPVAAWMDDAGGAVRRVLARRLWAKPAAVVAYAALAPVVLVAMVCSAVQKDPMATAVPAVAQQAGAVNVIAPKRAGQWVADHTPLRIYGTSTGMIAWDLAKAGVPAQRIDDYLNILGPYVGGDSIGKGDHYDIVLDRTRWPDGETQMGGVIYAGLYQPTGVQLHLSQWTKDGKVEWFDAGRASGSHDDLQRPVPGVVSSNYGPRMHPILGYTRMHKGTDFRAGFGTPILAVQSGWVAHAGWEGSFGNQVELVHGAGLSTTYSHMEKVGVAPGTMVRKGQVIGWVGATGLATGPHLHFELHRNGEAINPASVRFTAGPQLKGRDLAGYQKRLRAILSLKAAATAKA